VLIVLLSSTSFSVAHAQQRIPGGDLPGRERERFIESPILQLDRRPDPVVTVPGEARPAKRRKCRDGKRRARC
jgi:hypothetical protein